MHRSINIFLNFTHYETRATNNIARVTAQEANDNNVDRLIAASVTSAAVGQ